MGFVRRYYSSFFIMMAAVAAYTMIFALLYGSLGSEVAALSMLPVVAIGWLCGAKAGFAAGVMISVPLNLLLLNTVGGVGTEELLETLAAGGGVPGAFVVVAAGVLVGRLRDLNEKILTQAKLLEHRASHDDLTGLPNRVLFTERLDLALKELRSGRSEDAVAVLFLDLDGFKKVNDTFGHDIGDQLLVEVSRRLTSGLRPEDMAARLSGDEFAILLKVLDLKTAVRTADRIVEDLREPFAVRGSKARVTASVGVAFSGSGEDRGGDLLRDADRAMYACKDSGRDRYQVSGL